jgi:hypothetical protein
MLSDDKPTYDKISKPEHYTRGIEVIKFLDSWNVGFSIGNVIKYLIRADHKHNSPKEDYLKALWYLSHEIKRRGFEEDLTKFFKSQIEKPTV